MNPSLKSWMPTLVAAAGGGAIEALAAANGYWLETIWLPAVRVAASWPKSRSEDRLRGRRHRLPIGRGRS